MTQDTRQSPPRLLLLLTLLLALGLRVYRLAYQELRGDEAFGYFFSLRPIGDIVRATLELQEPHPVASYLMQNAWLRWAGDSEFALRFLGVWFAVLAVALIYRLGRRLRLGDRTSTLAAFLLAISPYAIWHSQDARMYSISLALTVASVWLALETLKRGRVVIPLAYLLVTSLALHVHYFAVFIVLAQNLFALSWLWLAPNRRQVAIRWFATQVLLVLLYLPWLLAARGILTGYAGTGDSPGLLSMLVRSSSVFLAGETVAAGVRPLVAVISLALLLLGALVLATSRGESRGRDALGGRWTLWLLLLYLVVPVGLAWLSSRSRPIFDERYLIGALPPFLLLVATGLSDGYRVIGAGARPRRWALLQIGLVLLWLAPSLFSLNGYYHNPANSKTRGWRELSAKLDRLAQGLPPQAVRLVQNYPDPTLWFYYDGPVEHLVLPPAALDVPATEREVSGLAAAGVGRAVLVVQPSQSWDDAGIAQRALAQSYQAVAEIDGGAWPILVYSRAGSLPAITSPSTFANGLQLVGFSTEPQPGGGVLVPGGVLVVHLDWAGSDLTLSGGEKLFLHLVDSDGRVAAQRDSQLDLQSGNISSYAIVLPEELQPGTYHLLAGLYDPEAPGSPRVPTVDGADSVDLATLIVGAP